MKRPLKFFTIVVMIICCCMLVSCVKEKSTMEKLEDRISVNNTMMQVASNQEMKVELCGTMAEALFIADGKVGKMQETIKLTVFPTNLDLLSKDLEYTINGEVGSVSGKLTRDNVGLSLSAIIEDIKSVGTIKNLIVKYDGAEYTFELKNVMEGNIDYKQALEVAYTAMQEKIDSAISNNSFDREIYIKMINYPSFSQENMLWYVSFIQSTDNYWAVLIDAKTGDIVSQRIMENADSTK